jgi:hypothetical protein
MSYDLRLHLVGEGFTADDADREARDNSGPRRPKGRAVLPLSKELQEEVIRVIHQADPSLEIIRSQDHDFVQLWSDDDAPRDWGVSPTGVWVSWPYTKTAEGLERVLVKVRAGLEPLYAMGFRAFDPQLDRALDSPADLGREAAETYAHVNQKMADKFRAPIGDARPKPWWKFW